MSTFKFHLRATQKDLSGYYYTRWDRAQKVTVLAKTKQEAINKADAMLGKCPRGRGWGWAFKTDLIEEAPNARHSEEPDR